MDSEILIYHNTEGNSKVAVRLEEEKTVIISSVGFSVKSQQETPFRIWATQRLKMKKLKLEVL